MTLHHLRAPRPAEALPAALQLGPVTLAIRAMRSIVTAPPASGPVADAIRTMRAADPAFDVNPDLIALRRALADRIEADIAALDMLGGDPDLEDGADAEPSLCGTGSHELRGNLPGYPQMGGRCGGDFSDIEGEDEHGGDINDEPHDPEEDDDRDSGCADDEGVAEQFGFSRHFSGGVA